MKKNDFFVGWSEDTPNADRRFFLGAGISLLGVAAGGAALLAQNQSSAGPGTWNMGEVRTFTGIATAEPYAMLRTADIDGIPKTALLSCLGKCGVSARIGSHAGKPATIRGSLIQRGDHVMIAVVDDIDWIGPATAAVPDSLAFPAMQPLGQIDLTGEILDSKCWFGAMRPSEGKVHKACAALCIRGGLPPAFFVKDKANKQALMIMTDRQDAHGPDLLPLVADPVHIKGEIFQWGNLLILDNPVSAITRMT